jgi:selenocysteine lyase/cysteine desulfurase
MSPDWDGLRRQMPVAQRWAYFDHAAVAPLSGPAQWAITQWAEDLAANGDAFWKRWSDRVEAVRALAARLISADPAEVALVHNTTEGINLVAEGFPWQEGDNVVVPADEFPSNLFPWMNLASRGVALRPVPSSNGRLEPAAVAEACDQRTRIVAVSWVGYASGWRSDLDALAEIAHQHGARLFVDAIQALGVFPIDVSQTQIDFLSADGHKWLLGPEGAGVFFIRRELLDLLRPLGLGWNSVVHAGDFTNHRLTLRPTAARYEGGSWNMPGIVGLGASLELLLQYGVAAMGQRIVEITDIICERLAGQGGVIHSRREGEHRSGIVSFELPGKDPLAVRKRCLEQGVVLSCRAGKLRVSPHAYCNEDDLERLMTALLSS